jgi:glucose-6-phosphate 1-dehydrogenase
MVEPQVLVIFGASGDLARRKLVPALHSLHVQGALPAPFAILGVGRAALTDESFRADMCQALVKFGSHQKHGHAAQQESFLSKLSFLHMDTESAGDYAKLSIAISSLCEQFQIPHNVVYYLAVPPGLSEHVPHWIALQGLNTETDGFKRIVVEKPFGHDLESAHALNVSLLAEWNEKQVYRIDHFLGKETVQNLLVFRFDNEIFDSMWNHRYVDYVEITAAESIGVESRAGYFDKSGIVRDMLQNHLLQVLAMVAMDPPINFDADCVRSETMKVFKCLRPFDAKAMAEDVVFGQYTTSKVKGQVLSGYRNEPGIPEDSRTETFVALKVFVDHPRWFNVPFYLRTGKRLPTRVSEIVLHFKKTPHPAFGISGGSANAQNQLVIRIQPDEGVQLKVGLKLPGAGFHVKDVNMDFHYSNLADTHVPEPYERLLLDAMQGDATLYSLGEAVESCWKFIDPILKYKDTTARLYGYPSGSWGPFEADVMMQRDKRQWRYPCKNLTSDGDTCEL